MKEKKNSKYLRYPQELTVQYSFNNLSKNRSSKPKD